MSYNNYNREFPPLGGASGKGSSPQGAWGAPPSRPAPPRKKISISLSQPHGPTPSKKKKVRADQASAPPIHTAPTPYMPSGPPPSHPPASLLQAGWSAPSAPNSAMAPPPWGPPAAYHGAPSPYHAPPYAPGPPAAYPMPPAGPTYTPPPTAPATTPPDHTVPPQKRGRGPKLEPGQHVPPENYPEAMRDYIRRAFALAQTDEERQFVKDTLDTIISKAIQKGTVLSRDWRAQCLPRLERWREKNAAGASPTVLGKRKPPAFQTEEAAINSHEQKQQRLSRFRQKDHQEEAFLPFEVDTVGRRRNDTGHLQGTCTILEKDFFRQTEEPDPALIRPEPVLREALRLVTRKWKLKQVEYVYMCNQFKSMRQDMTIQHIRNPFTIKVYETHARVALEQDDLNEFNQCQTRLKSLYDEMPLEGHPDEFLAYRLLYLAYSGLKQDHLGPLLHAIQELTHAQRQHQHVQHALQVTDALVGRNYRLFFVLYERVGNMGGYLMDKMLPAIRLLTLRTITRAYVPEVTVEFLASQLHLESVWVCAKFLQEHGGVVIRKPGMPAVLNTTKSKITP